MTQPQTTDWYDELYPPDDPDDLLTDEEFMAKYPLDNRPLDPDAAPKSGDDADDEESPANQDDSTDATPAPVVNQQDLDDLDAYLATGPSDHQVDQWLAQRGMLGGPEAPAARKPSMPAEELSTTLDELHARGASDTEIDRAMQEAGVW